MTHSFSEFSPDRPLYRIRSSCKFETSRALEVVEEEDMAEAETVNGAKETKLWKVVFAVSGIMSTLVIYGLLQVCVSVGKILWKFS